MKNAFLGKLLSSSDKFSDEQVAQTINMLIEHGVKHQASDIHIEPQDRFAQVRYRVDNVLRNVHKLPLAALPAVIDQLKELARMKGESHVPGEGQYAALVGEDQFEIQVYTMPVVGGEKAVLHISRRLNKPPTLTELGFWGDGLLALQQVLARSHGLILVAAPRRNGKTTTLHSMLQTVNTPSISVATVEHAIEYRASGASQTQVRPLQGITFEAGLQAALHQDPNIIMVSDVASKPTINLAVQAAAGGHLILAGMYSDNAPAALAHLQAMSDEPFLYASAVKLAVSQRLVRRLCRSCRQQYLPSPAEIQEIEKTFGITTAAARQKVHQLEIRAVRAGIGGNSPEYSSPSGITSLWQAAEAGCEHCNHTGYRDVGAIVEVLPVEGSSLQDTLLHPVSGSHLRRLALKEGFVSMELDGLVKALRGQTTLTELLRVLAL